MEAELKAKWLAALRSGEYKQGMGFLFNAVEGCYCCLGVLNICAGKSAPEIDGLAIGDTDRLIYPGDGPEDSDGDHVMKLMRMNDSGSSFVEIADWIEKNL